MAMLQQQRPRRLAIWLALWAMLLGIFVPLAHTAQGMGLGAQSICGVKQNVNDLDNKAKTPASECPICQFIHQIGGEFTPPTLLAVAVLLAFGLIIWRAEGERFSLLPRRHYAWARGPPLPV
ncbi:MAG: DUF2946 family protein [Alphaproteobacteria bacterium]|nr:DUF2946 family protein [Alphaproteobacteria bacterium]